MELFTEAWAQAYCRKLNESEAYRKAASTWEGSLALAVRPDPKAEADFVIEADLATWQEVLEGRLEPLSALMRGLLELKKGTIAALAPYAQAAQELVKVAREVA